MSEHIDRYTLEAYVENDLLAVQRRMVEAHVTVCPACQARLAVAKQIPALLYGLPREQPAPDLAARINVAVTARRALTPARWTNGLVLGMFVVGLVLFALAAPQRSGWVQAASSVQLPTEQTLAAWLGELVANPIVILDSLTAFAEQALMSSVEEMNALLTLATALLAVASIAGLAQLLGEYPSAAAREARA
jgi:predicted anti-sigma-YlaC factor YlaD